MAYVYIPKIYHLLANILAVLLSFTLLIESRLICFPKVTKIFQFTSFN